MLYTLKNISIFCFISSALTGIWSCICVMMRFISDPQGKEYAAYTLPIAIIFTVIFLILGFSLQIVFDQLEAEKFATAEQIAELKKELTKS